MRGKEQDEITPVYRFTYRISKKQERVIERDLNSAGITAYFIESTGKTKQLNIFSESSDNPRELNGLDLISVEDDDESAWKNSWAENYTGHELTDNIYVIAPGFDPPLKKYRYVIQIDPRDSFGDGHHPTSRLCASILEEYISEKNNPGALAMIDAGTGSGLLAIIAYILGLRMIDLFDIDAASILMAEKNLNINGISGLKPVKGDLYTFRFEKKYDIITANLLTGLIEDNLSSLAGALNKDGALIISGISAKWTSLALQMIKRNNLNIIEHKRLEEWNGFLLKKTKC